MYLIKNKYYQILVIAILFSSCGSWRKSLICEGGYNEAIKNAIYDFTNTSRFSKKDSVFYVFVEDLEEKYWNVAILSEENKLFPTEKNKIGSNRPYFPTKYLIENKKLFYWYDSTSFVTNDLVEVLVKYNQIDSLNANGFVGIPDYTKDESKPGMLYYFCKCNILKYKKIISVKTMKERKLLNFKYRCKDE
jgi:hypothetical protein